MPDPTIYDPFGTGRGGRLYVPGPKGDPGERGPEGPQGPVADQAVIQGLISAALAATTIPQNRVFGLADSLASKSDQGHGHTVADILGLQTSLDSKSNTGHGHTIPNITGLQTALDAKAALAHPHNISDVFSLQTALDGKAGVTHAHPISEVTGLQTALDGKVGPSHNHTIAQVTGLQAQLDAVSGTPGQITVLATRVTNAETRLTGLLHVATFNVLPTNTAAQNDVGLLALRNYCRTTDNDRLWTVVFDVGLYQYTNNMWTRGIKKLELIGYGTILQCTLTTGAHAQKRLFNESTPFYTSGDVFSATVTYTGFPINLVNQGSMNIVLSTIGNASNFAVGDRVLIGGRDQQFGGFPANLKHFQYARIVDVNLSTGTLRLSAPCEYTYRPDWPTQLSGDSNGMGQARVYNLDRGVSNYIHPEIRILRGFTLRRNTTNANPQGEVLTGDYVLWEDIKVDGEIALWPSIADRVEVKRIKPVGATGSLSAEPDKIVKSFLLEDFELNSPSGLYAGTGIAKSTIRRGRVSERTDYTSIESVQFEHVHFNRPAPTGGFGIVQDSFSYSTGRVSFRECKFSCDEGSALLHVVNAYSNLTAIPASVSATGLYWTLGQAAAQSLIGAALPGHVIYSTDGTDLGVITQITQDGNGYHTAITWIKNGTPSTAKTYRLNFREIVDLGGNEWSRPVPFERQSNVYASNGYIRSGLKTVKWSLASSQVDQVNLGTGSIFPWTQSSRFLTKVDINVLRPYSGANATAKMDCFFDRTEAGGNAVNNMIDLKIAGTRTILSNSTAGANATDALNALTNGPFYQMSFVLRDRVSPFGALAYASPAEAAIWSIEIEYAIPSL